MSVNDNQAQVRAVAESEKPKSWRDLVLLLVRARLEKGMAQEKKEAIAQLGKQYGLLDERGGRTAKYFALLDTEVENLTRQLVGQVRLCVCGCGRRAQFGPFARKVCRFTRRVRRKSVTAKMAVVSPRFR
jgi:hypothetical protein